MNALTNLFKPAQVAPVTAPVVDPAAVATAPIVDPMAAPVVEKTGLDTFAALVDTNLNKPADPGAPPLTAQEFLSPENIAKLSEGLDFTKDLPANVLQGLQENKPEALMALVNAVGVNAYKTALQHNGLLNDNILNSQLAYQNDSIDSRISQNNSAQELLANLPEMSNPIVKLGMESVVGKIQQANPDWNGEQVATEARRYLQEMNKTINPEATPAPAPGTDFDYLDFATQS